MPTADGLDTNESTVGRTSGNRGARGHGGLSRSAIVLQRRGESQNFLSFSFWKENDRIKSGLRPSSETDRQGVLEVLIDDGEILHLLGDAPVRGLSRQDGARLCSKPSFEHGLRDDRLKEFQVWICRRRFLNELGHSKGRDCADKRMCVTPSLPPPEALPKV